MLKWVVFFLLPEHLYLQHGDTGVQADENGGSCKWNSLI